MNRASKQTDQTGKEKVGTPAVFPSQTKIAGSDIMRGVKIIKIINEINKYIYIRNYIITNKIIPKPKLLKDITKRYS